MGGPKAPLEDLFTQEIELFLTQDGSDEMPRRLAKALVWHVRDRLDWSDSYRDELLR